MGKCAEWLVVAGQRPSSPAVVTNSARLHLGLLGDLQRIDPKPTYAPPHVTGALQGRHIHRGREHALMDCRADPQ
jgi:hypothetical protein